MRRGTEHWVSSESLVTIDSSRRRIIHFHCHRWPRILFWRLRLLNYSMSLSFNIPHLHTISTFYLRSMRISKTRHSKLKTVLIVLIFNYKHGWIRIFFLFPRGGRKNKEFLVILRKKIRKFQVRKSKIFTNQLEKLEAAALAYSWSFWVNFDITLLGLTRPYLALLSLT